MKRVAAASDFTAYRGFARGTEDAEGLRAFAALHKETHCRQLYSKTSAYIMSASAPAPTVAADDAETVDRAFSQMGNRRALTSPTHQRTARHIATITGNDALRAIWEQER